MSIIKSFEARELKKRPLVIRIADNLTSSFGSIFFLIINIIFFAGWISVNTGNIPGVAPFDIFPFPLLTTIVSLEAIFLAIIVLMSQQRQSYVSTLREELDMQVNLISEREITKILKLLKELSKKADKDFNDPELEEMIRNTDISYIERRLQQQIEGAAKESRSKIGEVVKPIVEKTEKIESQILPKR